MRIQFSDLKEFQEELTRDQDLIHRRLIRVTKLFQRTGETANRNIIVVAGALVPDEGLLVELRVYCGTDWGKGLPISAETHERADKLIEQLEAWAKDHGIDVRAGMFLPDKEVLG